MRFLPGKPFLRSLCTGKLPKKTLPETLHPFTDDLYLKRVEQNVLLRKHNNNVPLIRELLHAVHHGSNTNLEQLDTEVLKLPNDTHPRLHVYGTEAKELAVYEAKTKHDVNAIEFSDVSKYMNLFRMEHLGNYTGHKSYYLLGKLAELEQALRHYTIKKLLENNFTILAVPDILPRSVIEGCGMSTEGERTQVYKLDSGMCLSGTSEMALGGYFANKRFKQSDLPIKVAAVSRCYRAETSGLTEEKGIYRVHQFSKVEMFSICTKEQSEDMLEHFKNIQIELFRNLDLKIRLLDMPPSELGAPAYQKYDIEAWMPGRKMWGEISSCSNCTDYQAKRLNIKYASDDNKLVSANTINGTAAAIPRLLISLIESNQVDKNGIKVPNILNDFLSSDIIAKDKNIPELKLLKYVKQI